MHALPLRPRSFLCCGLQSPGSHVRVPSHSCLRFPVISLIPASLHSYRPATIRSTVNGPTSVVSASPTRIELNLWTLTANLESHRFPEFRGLELRIAAKRPWVCAPASRPGSQQPQASTASHATHPRARAPDPPQHHKDPPGPHNTTPG